MARGKERETATLLDVLIDGFEKNEILYGFHWRELPMPDEAAAIERFDAFVDEARHWKGEPRRAGDERRRLAAWDDLEIRQADRGVMVRVRAPWFSWWHEPATWSDDPMGAIRDWIRDEADAQRRQS